MIGTVRQLHLLMPIAFRLAGKPDRVIEFVVDTGFTGLLTLPTDMVGILGLPFLHVMPVRLADGSQIEVDVHSADIVWHALEASVEVLSTGNRPLLGTALLDGSELLAQFADGGLVTIEELEPVAE